MRVWLQYDQTGLIYSSLLRPACSQRQLSIHSWLSASQLPAEAADAVSLAVMVRCLREQMGRLLQFFCYSRVCRSVAASVSVQMLHCDSS